MSGEYASCLSPIEDIIEDARNGRMFILVDHEDRENEGDLVIPAQMATPQAINFMARYGRGLICLSMSRQRVEQLGLTLMSRDNLSRHQTAFTVSIEAREGVTTGISAHDRAHTIAVAIDPSRGAQDLATPGHVFPLVARDGGVLVRDGRVFAARRGPGSSQAGWWEIPGGKVEPGETEPQALVRELAEELAVDTRESCLAPLAFASHAYEDFHLLMPLYACRVWQGQPQPVEGQELAWVKAARLWDYPMPPADRPLIALLQEWL